MTTPDEFSPIGAMAAWMQAIAPHGIFTTDRDVRIRSWNEWLAVHSGYRDAQVLGRPLVELFPDLSTRHLDRYYARALQGEIIVLSTALHKYLLPFPPTSGQGVIPHMLQTVRIAPLSEGGVVVGTITVIEDVTQRELQSRLLQRQQELERLLSAALATLLPSGDPSAEMPGIFASLAPVLRLDGYLSYLPDAAGEKLVLHSSGGFSPKQREAVAVIPLTEATRQSLRSATAPSELRYEHAHASTLRRLGVRAQSAFPLVAGDRLLGLIVFATYQHDAIAAADISILSRIARYIALALDRWLRERETEAASRAKDDFLAALSHELRTPLNPVLLIASESEANGEFPTEAREAFRLIEKNVLLEARLIDDLLDLTRIRHGKLALEMELVDLHTVLRDAIETVRADITGARLSLELDLAASSHIVLGDAGRLQQVFWNVLKNALKFTPAGGAIRISTRSDSVTKQIVTQIVDTGIGMEEHELTRVFGAFAQGDHSLPGGPHRFGGLGLGLAISRNLVESHRGKIDASSAGKNLGATFVISLPLVPAGLQRNEGAGAPSQQPAATNAAVKKIQKTILLVEDHEPSRATLSHLLRRRGYDVIAVASAAAALESASQAPFDVVISDIGLPDMHGTELMRLLRDKYRAVGIALTGYGMEDDLTRSTDAGFFAHLTKPITVDALDRALAKLDRKGT